MHEFSESIKANQESGLVLLVFDLRSLVRPPAPTPASGLKLRKCWGEAQVVGIEIPDALSNLVIVERAEGLSPSVVGFVAILVGKADTE